MKHIPSKIEFNRGPSNGDFEYQIICYGREYHFDLPGKAKLTFATFLRRAAEMIVRDYYARVNAIKKRGKYY